MNAISPNYLDVILAYRRSRRLQNGYIMTQSAPESNPDEYLNNDFKFNLRQTPPSEDKKTLLEKAIHFMKRLQETPSHVAAYFRHPKVAYAA